MVMLIEPLERAFSAIRSARADGAPLVHFTPTGRRLDQALVREFASKVMLEAKAIGERLGIPILQQPEDRHAVTAKLGAFKTSMLQDVQAGRAVEIDALVTVMHELGRLTHVPTPNTDILLGLARLHARTLGLY